MANDNKEIVDAIHGLSADIEIDRIKNHELAARLSLTSAKLDKTCDDLNVFINGKDNNLGIKAKVSRIEDTQRRWSKYFTFGIVAVIGLISNAIKDFLK